MLKNLLLLSCCAVSFSVTSASFTVVSKIKDLRSFPEAQPVQAAARHVVFNLEQGLSPGCDLVYVSPDSEASISILMSAKISEIPIRLVFTDTPSPWHDRTCTAVEVSLN